MTIHNYNVIMKVGDKLFKKGDKVIIKSVSKGVRDESQRRNKTNSIGMIGVVWDAVSHRTRCAICVEKKDLEGKNIDSAWKLDDSKKIEAKLDKDKNYYCLGWYFQEDEIEHYFDTPRDKIKYTLLQEVE